MTEQRPEVSVVIVSYNTRAMTLRCLQTLLDGLGGLRAEVWVVDNASTDGSADAIRDAFPRVRLIANATNAGFGKANNQAMRAACGEFLLLLNSDAFPEPGAIAQLVEYARAQPRVGVVGPRLNNADGSMQVSCHRFPSPARSWLENLGLTKVFARDPWLGDYSWWAHDTEREVDFAIGACLLVRCEVYETVGGFDERFFMYAEEADWQKRIHAAGWTVSFTPTARVTHLAGASGAAEKVRINQHFFESLDHYIRKHHGFLGLLSLRAAMAIGCLSRAIFWSVASWFSASRERARSKARLHAWLVVRQATHWRFQ